MALQRVVFEKMAGHQKNQVHLFCTIDDLDFVVKTLFYWMALVFL